MAIHTNYLKELDKERAAFQKFQESLERNAQDALIRANKDINNPYLMQQEQQRLKNEYLATRTRELAHHQGNMRTALKEATAKLERDRVKAESGHNIIMRYATENGITFDDAEKELNRYAQRITAGFDPSKTADQYAALIHKQSDKLMKSDSQTAYNISKQEMDKINYNPRLNEVQSAEMHSKTDPSLEIQRQQTSGEVIANQLYGDV